MENRVYYHADDFGVSMKQTAIMVDCNENGVLNSVSIIPNTGHCEECFAEIDSKVKNGEIRCVVHLNFIEGSSLAPAESVPHLLNEKGMLGCSFVSVLKMNYSSKREMFKQELKREIEAQIARVVSLTGTKKINIDSHQHFHMIPIVWEAIMEVVNEQGYEIEYLRISLDPLSILVSTPSVWRYLKPMNLIKWLLLGFLCPGKKKLQETGAKIPVFFGLFFTCEMKWDVVQILLPKYQAYAEKRNRDLELMFHPGAVVDEAELLDASNLELKEFYASSNREDEKRTLMTLKS